MMPLPIKPKVDQVSKFYTGRLKRWYRTARACNTQQNKSFNENGSKNHPFQLAYVFPMMSW